MDFTDRRPGGGRRSVPTSASPIRPLPKDERRDVQRAKGSFSSFPQGRRVESTDLQKGDTARLAIGHEGETMESRVMRGLGQHGVATGTVLRNDSAGVHLRDARFEYVDQHDGNKVKTTGLGAGMRFLHSDISHAMRLPDER